GHIPSTAGPAMSVWRSPPRGTLGGRTGGPRLSDPTRRLTPPVAPRLLGHSIPHPTKYDAFYRALFVNAASTSTTSTCPPTFASIDSSDRQGSSSAAVMRWASAPRDCRALDNGTYLRPPGAAERRRI